MVCEKNKEKVHNFLKDPIELVRKDNLLMATAPLSAPTTASRSPPAWRSCRTDGRTSPLEFLFTVDEETGLTGANNLEEGFLKAKILLNLDSEEEGSIYVGCSGGRDAHGLWKVDFEAPPPGASRRKFGCAAQRGHSGLEIEKGRGNAIKSSIAS